MRVKAKRSPIYSIHTKTSVCVVRGGLGECHSRIRLNARRWSCLWDLYRSRMEYSKNAVKDIQVLKV